MQHTQFWRKLREWTSVLLLPVLIVLTFVGAAVRIAENNREAEQERQAILRVQCISIQSDQVVLSALADISKELGIPVPFKIPEVPAACENT